MNGVHTIWQGGLPSCFVDTSWIPRTVRSNTWRAEEDELLRTRYPKEGSKPLEKVLGRTARAIQERARVLGIRWNKSPSKKTGGLVRHLAYSEAEVNFLRENYLSAGAGFCAERLNRPEKSISDKARKLGITIVESWTEDEDAMLRDDLKSRCTLPEMCEHLKRGPRSVWNRLRRLGLVGAVSAAALAGCSSAKPVEIAVQVPCRVAVPSRPVMPTESLAPDVSLDDFIAAATAEIERREGYEIELRAVVEACQSPR